jgi:hypothetical protein
MPQPQNRSEYDEIDDAVGDQEISHDDTPARLKNLEGANSQLQELMQDPDVLTLLAARRSNKKVKIVEETPEEPSETEEDSGLASDIPENDPSRKLFEKLDRRLSDLVERRFKSKVEPLNERLQRVEVIGTEVQRKSVEDQVKAAREKYRDLDTYREPMLKLSTDNPGLNVEELYLLARQRAGKLRLLEQGTHTEKPTQQPRKIRDDKNKPNQPRTDGRRGFTELLGNSLRSLDLDT